LGVGLFLPKLPIEDSIEALIKKTKNEEKALRLVEKLRAIIIERSEEYRATGSFLSGVRSLKRFPHYQHSISHRSPVLKDMSKSLTSSMTSLVGELEPEQAAMIVKELREHLPKYSKLVGLLGTKFIAMLLQKASDNIELSLREVEKSGDPLLLAAARGLSSVSSTAAKSIYSPPPTMREQEEQVIAVLEGTQS
jgi:hypothetical protein